MKRLLIILPFIFCTLTLFSQVEVSTEKAIINGTKYYIHTVGSGQTLYSISKAYGVTIDDIQSANTELGTGLKLGQVIYIPIVEDGKYIAYKVKPGDTLYSLLRKYKISESEFYELNTNLKKDKPLKVGEEIKFPSQIVTDKVEDIERDTINYIYHLVEKGETLYRISKEYNVKVYDILEINSEIENRNIKPGMVIKIPKKPEELMSERDLIIDSLANINYGINSKSSDTIPMDTVKGMCDSVNWYSYGKDLEIAILFPFEANANMVNLYNQDKANRKQRINDLSREVIAFYGGCLIALEKFKNTDVNIKINVYDIGRNNNALAELIKDKQLQTSDLIIGPVFKGQIEYLNDNLGNSNATIILPFVNDEEIVRKYPNNIMLRPSETRFREAVADYASSYQDPNILIIQNSGQESINMAAEYQNLLSKKNKNSNSVKIINYNGKELVSLKSVIDKNKENIFISTINDEASITQMFTNLFPFKDYNMTFIGNIPIINYETIDPSYYSRVKFSYYSHTNIDYNSDDLQAFLNNFRESFLFEPDQSAFLGYDVINYIVEELLKYGNKFSKCFKGDITYNGISGDIQLVRKNNFRKNSYYNNAVYIYTLQPDYQFKVVYPPPINEIDE